jgi:hypothetical protein
MTRHEAAALGIRVNDDVDAAILEVFTAGELFHVAERGPSDRELRRLAHLDPADVAGRLRDRARERGDQALAQASQTPDALAALVQSIATDVRQLTWEVA